MREREAMRIMEAFTGVDQELLARCEEAGGGEKKAAGGRKYNKWSLHRWRYLGSCAALLCLFAAGAVSWRGFRELSTDRSGDGSAPESGIYQQMEPENSSAKGEMETTVNNMSDYIAYNKENAELQSPAQSVDNLKSGYGDGNKSDSQDILKSSSNGGAAGTAEAHMEGTGVDSAQTELSTMDGAVEGCPAYEAKKLTQAEAWQVETLSGYIPAKLPEGYVFREASCDLEQSSLRLVWFRGMDSIVMGFRKVEGEAPETVDISKPETYDERLYELPHGETVPREYWAAFNSPVFAKDDFSLEIVSSRVLSYSGDSGDTSTPRGSFSVLYDGVLVSFNGRGTPEQIWEMFASIQE